METITTRVNYARCAASRENRTGAYAVREDRKRSATKQVPEISGGGVSEEPTYQ